MNKEELIRNLKYTERKHRNDTVDTFDTDISMMCSDVLRVLENCIEITEGATNGDMIMAMFPDAQIEILDNVVCTNIDNVSWFSLDWWNAPYKKEVDDMTDIEKVLDELKQSFKADKNCIWFLSGCWVGMVIGSVCVYFFG